MDWVGLGLSPRVGPEYKFWINLINGPGSDEVVEIPSPARIRGTVIFRAHIIYCFLSPPPPLYLTFNFTPLKNNAG